MNPPQRVRGGGTETRDGFLFEMSGGNPALDLVNTLDCRPTERRRDLLGTYEDLVAWGEQSGALAPAESARLRRAARSNPAAARRTLGQVRRLREAMFSIFSSVVAGTPPPSADVGILNKALAGALGRLRVDYLSEGFAWAWSEDDRLDRVIWPAVRAAGELLVAGDLTRLRVCASDECDWLFMDTSRNRSRRWCDMSVCGNRSKVRGFYHRQKKAAD